MGDSLLTGLVFALTLCVRRGSSVEPCIKQLGVQVTEHIMVDVGALDVRGEFEVRVQSGSDQKVARVEVDAALAPFVRVAMVGEACPLYESDVDFAGDDDNLLFGVHSALACAERCKSQGSSHFTSDSRDSRCLCKHGPGTRRTVLGVTSGQACLPPGHMGCAPFQTGVDFFGDDDYSQRRVPSASDCALLCKHLGSPFFTSIAESASIPEAGDCFCKHGTGIRGPLAGATSGQACGPPGVGVSVLSLEYTESFSSVIESCGVAAVKEVRPKVTLLVPEIPASVSARDGADVSFVGPVVSGPNLTARAVRARIHLAVSQVTSLHVSASGVGALVDLSGGASASESLAVSALSDAEVILHGNLWAPTFNMFSARRATVSLPRGSTAAADKLSITSHEDGEIIIDGAVTAQTLELTKRDETPHLELTELDETPHFTFHGPISAGALFIREPLALHMLPNFRSNGYLIRRSK